MKPKIKDEPISVWSIGFLELKKNKLFKWLKKEIPEQIVASPMYLLFNGKWRTIRTDGGWIIYGLKQRRSISYSRIIPHVCEMLFDKVGIEHNLESGELWAYMQQFYSMR